MKETLQIKRRFNLERKDYSINYLENSKNNTSEKDVNVSKPTPNPSTTTNRLQPLGTQTDMATIRLARDGLDLFLLSLVLFSTGLIGGVVVLGLGVGLVTLTSFSDVLFFESSK